GAEGDGLGVAVVVGLDGDGGVFRRLVEGGLELLGVTVLGLGVLAAALAELVGGVLRGLDLLRRRLLALLGAEGDRNRAVLDLADRAAEGLGQDEATQGQHNHGCSTHPAQHQISPFLAGYTGPSLRGRHAPPGAVAINPDESWPRR